MQTIQLILNPGLTYVQDPLLSFAEVLGVARAGRIQKEVTGVPSESEFVHRVAQGIIAFDPDSGEAEGPTDTLAQDIIIQIK